MKECDFSFRGELLSDHGYMLCQFGNSDSNVAADSQKNFTSISMFNGKYLPIIYASYTDALVLKMSVCRACGSKSYIISPTECSSLKKWLNSPTAEELRLGGEDYNGYFWSGSFNIEEVHYAGKCIGFDLTFTATAPFGYKNSVSMSGSVNANSSIVIDDVSDEEGYIYPDISITLKSAGNLEITNSFDSRKTIIKNCKSGETIKFNKYLQITSSDNSHNINDDFNYKFIRIHNIYNKTSNTLTFNLPCSYSISYTPIAKVVIP